MAACLAGAPRRSSTGAALRAGAAESRLGVRRQGFDYFERFDTHPADLAEQDNHRFLVFGEAVEVEFLAEGRVFGREIAVLIQHPFQRRTVA